MSDLPTGTVTLLLADVEERLWETQPDEMTAAVARLIRWCWTSSPPVMESAR